MCSLFPGKGRCYTTQRGKYQPPTSNSNSHGGEQSGHHDLQAVNSVIFTSRIQTPARWAPGKPKLRRLRSLFMTGELLFPCPRLPPLTPSKWMLIPRPTQWPFQTPACMSLGSGVGRLFRGWRAKGNRRSGCLNW